MMNFDIGPHFGEVLEIGLVGLVLIIYSICSAYKHKKSCEVGLVKPPTEYVPGSENDSDNKQRSVSYDKQLRRAERKAVKLKAELEARSIPRKAASPHYINVPHSMRTIRPLIEDRMRNASIHLINAADALYFGMDEGYEK